MPINDRSILDISRAYGYYMGQSYTLESIEKKYPKLSNQVRMAKGEFNISFLSSIENIDLQMSKHKVWRPFKSSMQQSIHDNLDVSSSSYSECVNFIETVKKRAKGEIESPVLETLLSFNKEYQKAPQKEFRDGFKKRYKSDDLIKSKGLTFFLEFPASWVSKKANRPNIVRKFISKNGYGKEMAMVLVYNFPGLNISKQEIKSFINDEYMKGSIPPDSILKDYGYAEIETLPGYWQIYTNKMQRGRKSFHIETLNYTLFYENKMIHLMFQIKGAKNKNLEKSFKKFEPLFDLIANSFVLKDLYR